MPYLDEEYATYQMGMSRAVIGDSMAATASLMAALKYPSIFGKVILQSPLVDEDVLKAVENFKDPGAISIYHIVGKKKIKLSQWIKR